MHRAAARGARRGFTLIEVLVTISILTILAAIGIPSFQQLIKDKRLETHRDALQSALAVARSAAIAHGRRAVVCAYGSEGPPPTCSSNWSAGWIAFIDNDDSGTPTAGDEILRIVNDPPAGVVVTPNPLIPIIFNTRGTVVSAVIFNITDDRNNTCRRLELKPSGATAVSTCN
ncbi:hypothetical protein Tther_01863 [Tepidimonas thermarum]|uniref:Type II secretion system protein H n=1 Tax=Tepidimonas thermarum TaxID=335431 RepID=A0A554WYY7_9BURK|nr:GspH/FimT family pseudopilin [Tepidimonas thermarum]TSE28789.1 hypothetical protein Tther_01863 [Tepidimonas thermarum]